MLLHAHVLSLVQQLLVGQVLLIIKVPWSLSDTSHLVGLLWTSDQPSAETDTWQLTALTRDKHTYSQQDLNPQSQQTSGHSPTP